MTESQLMDLATPEASEPFGAVASRWASLTSEASSVEETGLDPGLLLDLCLKTVYYAGRPSARILCERLGLPFVVVESLLVALHRQEMLDIVGSGGRSEQDYVYSLTTKGIHKTQEALEKNQYVGQAPIPFDQYVAVVNGQTITDVEPPEDIASFFSNLILGRELLDQLGTAVVTGKSLFLYGDPGNGKSAIAEAIGASLPGSILVPYAIEAYGQIIRVFDPRIHHVLPDEVTEDVDPSGLITGRGRKQDRRWARCRRPVVITGGELTLSDLDLRYSPVSKYYAAPVQLKSNNGVLVIDDFGRQLVRPEELLNRWMIPLERRVDHLTFHTGETLEVPFDVMLILATNIPPSRLGDEAFFRRIRHKVRVNDPDEASFRNILRREAERASLSYSEASADYLIQHHYQGRRPFRGVHPRDLVALIVDTSRFRRVAGALSPEWIDQACHSYFVED